MKSQSIKCLTVTFAGASTTHIHHLRILQKCAELVFNFNNYSLTKEILQHLELITLEREQGDREGEGERTDEFPVHKLDVSFFNCGIDNSMV